MKQLVHSSSRLAQYALLAAFPHGGQGVARRNAWAGMAQGATRARGRREAEAALRVSELRAQPVAASDC